LSPPANPTDQNVSVFFPSFQIMASIRLNRTQGGVEDARSGNPVMVRAGDNSPRPKGGFYEE
jgi:hypothetical protein